MAKIILNKESFSKILSSVSNGLPTKEIIGTDGLFKIDIEDNRCTVSVVNSRVQMQASLTCKSDVPSVEMCIHNRVLMEMVRNFPDGDLVITTEESKEGNVKAINIKPEGRKKYKIACNVSSDFPKMIELDGLEIFSEFEIQSKQFADLMRTMASNVDPNNVVPSFANIVGYSLGGKLTFIAGDQKLIHIVQTEIDLTSQFILPKEIAKYISHMNGVDKCQITLASNRMFITYSGFEMSLSLIDGKVSEYKALIDTEPGKNALIVNKKDLSDSLSRLSIFTDETERIIMNIDGVDCDMQAVNPDYGNEGSEVITIVNHDNITDKFALKHSVMKKACANIPTDNIQIKRSDRIAFMRAENRKDILWMAGLSTI